VLSKQRLAELIECRDKRIIDTSILKTAHRIYNENSGWTKKMGADDRDALCAYLLRADIEYYQMYLHMLEARYDLAKPSDPMFDGIIPRGLPEFDPDEPLKLKPQQIKLTYNAAVEKYLASKTESEWIAKTKAEHKRVLGWFAELGHGKTPLRFISKEDATNFRDILKRLPPNLEKKNKNRGFNELVHSYNKSGKKIMPNTLQRYYGAFYAFFKWAVEEGHIKENPLPKGKIVKRSEMKSEKREFSKDELYALFNSPMYKGCDSERFRSREGTQLIKDDQYWLPLLGYHHHLIAYHSLIQHQ
jgi:hypothetical protein